MDGKQSIGWVIWDPRINDTYRSPRPDNYGKPGGFHPARIYERLDIAKREAVRQGLGIDVKEVFADVE